MSTDLSAESIQQLARAFSRSRVLLTAAELDIFTLLASAPMTADEVTVRLNSNLRATTILLDALASMELLHKENLKYRTNPVTSHLLTADSADSILPGLLHSSYLWKTWSQLTDVVIEGGPASKSATSGEDKVKAFIGAMHVRAQRDAPDLIKAVNPGKARNLLDVGGGSGSYTISFLRAVPGMKATLFDLPDVIPIALDRISQEGLNDRVTLEAGDFYEDDLPAGHDLAFLSFIIHQNSHSQNVALYKNVYNALDPGGRIVVRDYAMSSDRTRPLSGALFAINMLVNTEGGNSYTFEEIRAGLDAAGFERVKLIQEKEMSSLVEAFKA